MKRPTRTLRVTGPPRGQGRRGHDGVRRALPPVDVVASARAAHAARAARPIEVRTDARAVRSRTSSHARREGARRSGRPAGNRSTPRGAGVARPRSARSSGRVSVRIPGSAARYLGRAALERVPAQTGPRRRPVERRGVVVGLDHGLPEAAGFVEHRVGQLVGGLRAIPASRRLDRARTRRWRSRHRAPACTPRRDRSVGPIDIDSVRLSSP